VAALVGFPLVLEREEDGERFSSESPAELRSLERHLRAEWTGIELPPPQWACPDAEGSDVDLEVLRLELEQERDGAFVSLGATKLRPIPLHLEGRPVSSADELRHMLDQLWVASTGQPRLVVLEDPEHSPLGRLWLGAGADPTVVHFEDLRAGSPPSLIAVATEGAMQDVQLHFHGHPVRFARRHGVTREMAFAVAAHFLEERRLSTALRWEPTPSAP